MVAFEGRGHHHEIGIAHLGIGAGMQMTVANHLAQHIFHSRLYDVETALIGHFHHLWVYIHADHLNAMSGSDDSRGQPNIA